MTSALSIYQQALDAVSAAVLSGDFPAYIAMLDLPYLIRMTDADVVLPRPDDLVPVFQLVSQGLLQRGVTHYERVAREAQFQRMDRIVGRHFTHMISNGERVAPPLASAAALVRREGGVWRFSEASYPFLRSEWPPTEAVVFGAIPTAPETGARA